MALGEKLAGAIIGGAATLPPALLAEYPMLSGVHFRRGGLPPRIGGWLLARHSVAAITLWNTVWLAPAAPFSAELLLHELRHVHQFQSVAAFPVRYLWESIRRGYSRNRFEVDARRYAAHMARRNGLVPPGKDA